jgi:hypothetical protein
MERQIQELEHAMGITSEPERLLEASLLVDRKFLGTMALTGYRFFMERHFGDEAWAGHLHARLLTRLHGNAPLSISFVASLHRAYLARTHPDATESFIDSKNPRGGRIVNGMLHPRLFADSQITEIQRNPRLRWLPEPGQRNEGYIGYRVKTRADRLQALDTLCTWFNESRSDRAQRPVVRAARLQREFVSIHPLAIDYNGRVARAVKQWSLETDGETPSMVADFDDDLLLSEEGWTSQVMLGCAMYGLAKTRIKQGETNPVKILGLTEEKAMYDQFYRLSGCAPRPEPDGSQHDHDDYGQFMALVSN